MKIPRHRILLALFGAFLLLAPLLVFANEGEHEGGESHFGVSDTIWKSINLVLFFGLFIFLLAKPIGNALRKRRESIQADLAEAARKRLEVEQTEVEIKRRIALLEVEANEFAAKAREEGEREKAELIGRGDTESARVLTQAREEVETSVLSARRELAAYAGQLAIELAAKTIESKLDDAGRRNFLDRAIEDLGGMKSEEGR